MSEKPSVVNAFTKSLSGGNPAGVCLLDTPLPEAEMQRIATEMSLAETAFVERRGGGYSIRWFTPTTEVPLCGHATLASAHLMWERGAVPPDRAIVFQSQSGPLTATRDGGWIALDFPADPPEPAHEPAGLADVLGAQILSVSRARVALIALMDSAEMVRRLDPDIPAIGKLAKAVIVTAASDDPGFDFISRFFGPGYGIPEDPVTGAAHCALAPLWAWRLGKTEMTAYQASARGGTVHVQVREDRVVLGGQAITVSGISDMKRIYR